MINSQAVATNSASLPSDQVVDALHHGLGGKFRGKRVLVLIPDHTRSLPLPLLFHTLVDVLGEAGQLDFLVALGTHPALAEAELQRLVGITAEDRANRFKKIGLLNHAWDQPSVMASLGSMEQDEIRSIAGPIWHPSLPRRVEICINKAALEHDQIIILGPTFPHEVVGFSGGAKYLFPESLGRT